MKKISSVLGLISPDDMGITLAHEHIVGGYPGWECDALSRPYNREKIVNVCMRTVGPVKGYGVKTIVDATTIDFSRDVEVLKSVSERLQINIICSTGMYMESLGKWAYLKNRASSKVGDMAEELFDTYMQEIDKGIGQTGVKAGVIKVATGFNRIYECEMASLKAAARAQRQTGVPIITHTENGTMGPEQLDVLLAEGADPMKIMCGHMCGNASIEYQKSVLSRGTFISFDRFGIEVFLPDKTREETLINLLSLGYGDRVLLSQDCFGCGLGRGGTLPEEQKKLVANWSYINIFRNILPDLKKAGVAQEAIDALLVNNPRRLFA